jgi:hypothetical protein
MPEKYFNSANAVLEGPRPSQQAKSAISQKIPRRSWHAISDRLRGGGADSTGRADGETFVNFNSF